MENLNQNYRCRVCGGELGWNPDAQKWKCRYCDAEFTLADMEEQGKTDFHEETYERGREAAEAGYTQATDDTTARPEDLRIYSCRYCGAQVITDKNTAATFCVYCNNPIVLEEQLVNGFTPRYVIPFQNTRQQVMERYLAFIKKPFTPDAFLSQEHVEKIRGVYIPFWLYDAKASGSVQAECENIRTHRRGNTETTDHDVYRVTRDGSLEFHNIPVDASSRTDNTVMDSIEPFDYQALKDFEMPYLAGFMAEKYDEDDKTCYPRAQERVINTLDTKLAASVTGYSTTRIINRDARLDSCSAAYALLPVWLLYTNYNGRTYQFAMNGQTGKIVGDIPIDNRKRVKCFFAYTGVIWAALSLVLTAAALLL